MLIFERKQQKRGGRRNFRPHSEKEASKKYYRKI